MTSTTERFSRARINSRDIAELIGVCKGVLANGTVDINECYFILDWLEHHRGCIDTWPASALYDTLNTVLEDGKLSSDAEGKMLDLLCSITGFMITTEYRGEVLRTNTSTTLPISTLDGPIIFEDKNFVLTGKFESGERKICESYVQARGGNTQKQPVQTSHYLVIGNVGNNQWAQSSYGRKIEKAMAMIETGHDIKIISETEWVKYL